jgi:hypothetical protein
MSVKLEAITSREFNRRLRVAYPSNLAILQIALDLRAGNLAVSDATAGYAKKLERFVATCLDWRRSNRATH